VTIAGLDRAVGPVQARGVAAQLCVLRDGQLSSTRRSAARRAEVSGAAIAACG
jgi:hypothetical protein